MISLANRNVCTAGIITVIVLLRVFAPEPSPQGQLSAAICEYVASFLPTANGSGGGLIHRGLSGSKQGNDNPTFTVRVTRQVPLRGG